MYSTKSSKNRRSAQTAYTSARPASRMYTERSLISEAGQFLNGKNLYDSNLCENKQYAYESLRRKSDQYVCKVQEDINVDIDDDVEEFNEYAASTSQRLMPTNLRNTESHMNSVNLTKYKAKVVNDANDYVEGSIITFGSNKKIRTKMSKIDKSLAKLHEASQTNWSK